MDLNVHSQCGCSTQLSPLVLIRFFLQGEINQENAFIYFVGHCSDVKGLAGTGKESGDHFSSLKDVDQNLSTRENKIAGHLMKRGGGGQSLLPRCRL